MTRRHDSPARILGTIAVALACAVPAAVPAQSPPATHVGILVGSTVVQRGHLEQALLQGLREQGYVEGKNLTVERRYADGDGTRLPEFASELAAMKLDVIVTTCSPSTQAARAATGSTPIVMAAVADPVGQHLIASLARPGANITGLSSQADELLPKRLEQLQSVLPKATVVAVLANAGNRLHAAMWQELERTAARMKLRLVRVAAAGPDELPGAVDEAVRERANALLVLPDDPMLFNWRASIVERAALHRLPDFYWASEFVEAGGLMSYGESLRASYRGAATYIDKVKRGAAPASLPVSQPTRFELAVNEKTARALGVVVPRGLLLQADQVIR